MAGQGLPRRGSRGGSGRRCPAASRRAWAGSEGAARPRSGSGVWKPWCPGRETKSQAGRKLRSKLELGSGRTRLSILHLGSLGPLSADLMTLHNASGPYPVAARGGGWGFVRRAKQ